MRRAAFSFLFLFCACSFFGCQRKPASDLTVDEKVAIQIEGQDELSADEQRRQEETRRAILTRADSSKNAEKSLVDALENARQLLPETVFANLNEVQQKWLVSGRGADANRLIQTGMVPADAFIQATSNRAQWIGLRVAWAVALEQNALFYAADKKIVLVAYHNLVGEGQVPKALLTFHVLNGQEPHIVITLEGAWNGDMAALVSQVDSSIRMNATSSESELLLEWTGDEALTTVGAQTAFGVVGNYKRLVPGSCNVFAL